MRLEFAETKCAEFGTVVKLRINQVSYVHITEGGTWLKFPGFKTLQVAEAPNSLSKMQFEKYQQVGVFRNQVVKFLSLMIRNSLDT